MHAELRTQLAFRLTGLRADARSESSDARALRPALTARYRNLSALRYDFPVVLLADPTEREFALPLTKLVDRVLEKIAGAEVEGATRTRQAALRLEREIRVLLAHGASGSLFQLWDVAASRLAAKGEDALLPDLARVRAAIPGDGELLDCGEAFPGEFVLRAWRAVQKRKAARFHDEVQRLIVGVTQILEADESRSPVARLPEHLKETFGTGHRDAFDFEAMSRLLARSPARRPLTDSRRRRLRALLVALETQRFYLDDSGFTFVYDRCGVALRTFRARYPRLRSLARSLAMARLEVDGEYDEARHDPLFQQMRQSALTLDELARFPDYLVRLREEELDAQARADLQELLVSGIPAKILVQTDDLLDDVAVAEGLAGVGARADAVTGMALGLNDVFVVQASASSLCQMGDVLIEALGYRGPALFSVFSGATGDSASLPPYLNAAAATESRAFPTFTYDPRKSLEEGSRFSLAGNPQPDSDWPAYPFDYEDAQHQRVTRELRLTTADFVASDERFAMHFLPAAAQPADADATLAMVDMDDVLRSLAVDESVVTLARRALDRWQRLQKLAAMGRVVVREVAAEAAPPAAEAAPAAEAKAPEVVQAPEPPKAASSDDPYIETPRCTTCNECTQINDRMFAYDGNKQAYIADVNAGTYRQLVEAAESCQVSIIHPGKPRNADEPGIEELLERAAVFR